MYTDILILTHLARVPAHGYEIKKHLERLRVSRALNNNVLYPSLQRLEAMGAIERAAAEADPGRPPRTVYRLTETGQDLLQALLRDCDESVLADEDEFQARVAFFDRIDPTNRMAIIAVRRRIVAARIAWHRGMREQAAVQPWGLQVVDFLIDRLLLEAAWLDRLAAQVE